MKPKLYPFLLIVFLSILAASCKTASKLYEKGNYDEAVSLAAKKLQKDPDDPKLLDIIRNSYRFAVEDHERHIRNYSESSHELKWEWMYNDYAALQQMYDAIRKVPAVFDIGHPTDYSSYLVTYAEKAGDTRYNRGLAFMDRGDKQNYRSAYHEFQAALNFKPGNTAIQQDLDDAWEYAVTNVVVLPLEQTGYRFSSFPGYETWNFDAQLIRNLQYSTGNEFVKFYSSGEARSKNIRADQVIDMQFSRMDFGRFNDTRNTRKVSKEVVVKETVYRPDSIVREYGKVYAQITTVHRNMRSEGFLQGNVRDADVRWLWSDHFSGNHNWSTDFATFTGDARALDETDKQLVNRIHEQPPREEEIVRCIMNDLDNSVLYRIREYCNHL
jgi:tetratricopeptide (TPR) repeat protein